MHETHQMRSHSTERLALLESSLRWSGRRHSYDLAPRSSLSASDEHVRVHLGTYLQASLWRQLSAEDQHLARMLGAHLTAATPPVFSHVSAAILLGMPIYGEVDRRVHVTTGLGGAGKPSLEIVRHRSALADDDVTEVGGVRCTTPDRTILDLARSGHAEVALAAADGYLRDAFRVGRSVDWARVARWGDGMSARIATLRTRNGVNVVKEVVGLADPRTDSVLESVSHLQLRRLGFEMELQVPVAAPNGGNFYVDFEFLGLGLFGECDGKQKYTDSALRHGLTADEAVYQEKRRQEWICARERKGMVRWGHPDVSSPRVLARRLAAFNVPIPRLPR